MQDPNEDTQWNDILRSKGIIPPKPKEKEVSEDDIIKIMDDTIKQKTSGKNLEDMNLDELNEKEDEIDEEDERIFEEYRRKRIAEMQEAYKSAQYGNVIEISRADYVEQVNKAGDGIWVVLHVYRQGIPLCNLINNYLQELAQKFPSTKFLKSVSSVCIPNYPDKNLPTVFVYYEGDLKKQWIGPHEFHGMNLTRDELEWMLSEVNAVKTTLEENPRKKIHDVMASSVRCVHQDSDDDDDDDDY